MSRFFERHPATRDLVVVFLEGGGVRIDLSDDGVAYLRVGTSNPVGRWLERLVMRELGVMIGVDDPELHSAWSIPDNYVGKPLSSELSTALLLRIADRLVAEVDPGLLAETWSDSLPVDCGDVRRSMVCSLAVDVPLSLELAGYRELAEQLYARRLSPGRLAEAYDDYRSFVRNNFNFENAYNYLDLIKFD